MEPILAGLAASCAEFDGEGIYPDGIPFEQGHLAGQGWRLSALRPARHLLIGARAIGSFPVRHRSH